MANKESTFGNAISLRQYLNEQLSSDGGYSNFMKITNVNNVDAVPSVMSVNTIIHDAQLVWVGDRFYLQGKKITTSNDVDTISQTYLFPFDAIAVEFYNTISDNTVIFNVTSSVPTEAKPVVSKQYQSITKGENYENLPTVTVEQGYYFHGWYTAAGGSGTQVTPNTTCNKIQGHQLYAHINTTAPSN